VNIEKSKENLGKHTSNKDKVKSGKKKIAMIYHFGNGDKLTLHELKSKVRQRTASIVSDGLGGAGRAH
jgi:2,3-bisphosphoglycerate-independent phosphoglycerate mutase